MDKLAESCNLYRDGHIRLHIPQDGGKVTCSVHVDNYPLRELGTAVNSLTDIASSFDKLGKRNTKKDFAHLTKHAMHLIRLYCVGIELLETGDIHTYREAEHDMLMDIRSGKYQNADGTYQPEFFELVNAYEKRLQYAKANTVLPVKPNYKRIEEFVISVNEQSVAV